MNPETRTLLSVKLEDIAECEAIFTTLMGEDVESRRKFIEDNASTSEPRHLVEIGWPVLVAHLRRRGFTAST